MANADDAAGLYSDAWALLNNGPGHEFLAAQMRIGLARSESFQDGRLLPDFATQLDEFLTAAGDDPENARSINNAAVALFVVGNFPDGEDAGAYAAGRDPFGQPEALMDSAMELLNRASTRFDDRAIVMNAAFFADIRTEEDPTIGLKAFVGGHPDDAGARLLLASLESRDGRWGGLPAALATIAPMRADPSLAGLADLAEGDAYVASADLHLGASPFLVHQLARQAVERFDRAIEATGDRSAFAGRAAALDLLGATADALAAQQAAIDHGAATSLAEVRVAELKGCLGDQAGRFERARRALDLTPGEEATLDQVRLLSPIEERTDRGYLGVSFGSERPGRPTYLEGRGAAGFIFTSEPERPPDPCLGPSSSPADAALEQALGASAALKNAADVEDAFGAYVGTQGRQPFNMGLVAAARMAVGTPVGADGGPGDAVLDLVPDLTPGDAAALCRMIRESDPLADDLELLACEARGASRAALEAGDPLAAQRALERGFAAQSAAGLQPDPVLLLEAASQAEARDDDAGAKGLYLQAASFEGTSAAAFSRLAQMAFRRDDLASALTLLDLAIAAADRADPQGLDPDVVRTRGYLLSNRGVTRLGLARTETDGAPDCSRFAAACALATTDLDDALAIDPANPVYLLNTAWVARLMGDTALARDRLAAVVAIAPDTRPALNDLGVLEARDGDLAAARGRFLAAIASDPAYEIARWNLGVLESADNPFSWPAGQRDLAEAAAAGPALKAEPIAYRTDEQIYAVDLQAGTTIRFGRRGSAPGASVAAAVASVVVVSGLVSLNEGIRNALKGLIEVGSARLEAVFTGKSSSGRRLLRRRFSPRTLGRLGWAAYVGVLALTTGLSAWTAWPSAQAAGIALAALATLIAVACHALAHIGAAAAHDVAFQPAKGRGGVLVGLAGILLQLPAGPYPGEHLTPRRAATAPDSAVAADTPRSSTGNPLWRISLAGPSVNIVGAAIALVGYQLMPIPFLRLLVVTHLTVAAFSLITAQSLDGSRLAERRAWVGPVLGLIIALLSASISAGAV